MPTLYAGPGKCFINNIALQPEGENGPIRLLLTETTAEIAAAMFGRVSEQVLDQTVDLTTRPFDNWGSLATLFPPYIGAKVGAVAAALAIGTRPHSNQHAKVWTVDGRLYDIVNAAVVGHPSLHLGVGKALFGDCRILGIPAAPGGVVQEMGTSGYLITSNAVTESGAPDPGGQMTLVDFVRETWHGAWGTVAGFGGDGGAAVQAEDEWTIESEVKYSPLKIQGRTLGMKLDSVAFMARVRPYGPTHSNILARVASHTQGQRLGSADLTLTATISGNTIVLKNAEVRGLGFEFGGTTIGTGEVAFVNTMQFTGGVAGSLIEFANNQGQ